MGSFYDKLWEENQESAVMGKDKGPSQIGEQEKFSLKWLYLIFRLSVKS